MGTRGISQLDAHFYILTEGCYMFKVPLANLHVDTAKQISSITIDRDYIRADTLFGVHRDAFSRHRKFFLISDKNRNMFMVQMFRCLEHAKGAIQLYELNGLQFDPIHPQHVSVNVYSRIYVFASIGLDSDISYAFSMDHSKLDRLYTLETINFAAGLNITQGSADISNRITMDFSSNTEIVTVFYLEDVKS